MKNLLVYPLNTHKSFLLVCTKVKGPLEFLSKTNLSLLANLPMHTDKGILLASFPTREPQVMSKNREFYQTIMQTGLFADFRRDKKGVEIKFC